MSVPDCDTVEETKNESNSYCNSRDANDLYLHWDSITARTEGAVKQRLQRARNYYRNADTDSVAECISERYADTGARAGTGSQHDTNSIQLHVDKNE